MCSTPNTRDTYGYVIKVNTYPEHVKTALYAKFFFTPMTNEAGGLYSM